MENPVKGPDLIDEQKVVEVKFKLVNPEKYNHLSWRVLGHQKNYGNSREAYWALGTYRLHREIGDIPNSASIKDLERLVIKRELYLVDWSWMNQFPEYRETGKTKKSTWDNILLFPKGKLLPETYQTHKVRGGKIYFTDGVDSERFSLAA